jgi:transcriptional regulator with XRE-family HTH domain
MPDPKPDPREGPTVIRKILGMQLRRLRESRGLTAEQAAARIRGSVSKINRIELGRSAVKEIDVSDLLEAYGVDATEREQLLTLAEQANLPGWWHSYNDILPAWFQAYIGFEESASRLRVYEPMFVPGLLQTPQYASAVLSLGDFSAAETERHVMVRKERQRRFIDGRLRLWVVVDETALRRPVGSLDVLRDQLKYLVSLSTRQNLTIQITPQGAGGHAAPNAFTILRFEEPEMPDTVYVEQLTSALYLDKRLDVDSYMLAMDRLSMMSSKPEETRGILNALIDQMDSISRSTAT